MSQAPDRDIVKEALKEINPAADKKAACEKEIRTCLSVLNDLCAYKKQQWPSPAEMKRDMQRLTKLLKKVEAILLSPACGPFRHMPAFLDYDRLMADLAKVRETADHQVKHSKTPRRVKSFSLVKWYAGKYAVSLIDKFGTGRPSKAQVASIIFYGATGNHDDNFRDVITAVHAEEP